MTMADNSNNPVPFGVVDYILFIGMLGISTITGIYHGFAKGGQHSTSRYLLADRKMHYIPVAMSIMVSFLSPVTIMGTSAEVFVHGTGHLPQAFSILWCLPLVTFLFVPVFHDLKVTSAYEYIELRFNIALRIIVAVIFMFQSLFFIAACLIGPALAIEAVLNFDFRYTLLITGALGTIYTALGGMKGVIWTDVFQFFVLYGTVLTIIILGVSNSGGMAEILRISGEDGRLNAFSFDFSPTKRLSFFSTTIGASFAFSPGFVSQTAVQRYMSVPSLKHSQMTILASMPFFYIYLCILYLAGLVISVYYDNGLTSLQLAINATLPTGFPNSLLRGAADANYEPNFKSPDQILMYFVSSQLGQVSGIQGLFVAGLFAALLSSVSSSLNAMTAITLEDFIKPFRKWKAYRSGQMVYTNDKHDTAVSKVLTCAYGLVAIGLAFIASRVESLLVLSTTIFAVPGGPTFGVFILGILYRRANGIGTLCGILLGFIFGLWISLGAFANQGSSEEVAAIYRLSFMMYATYSFAVTVVTSIIGSEIINMWFKKGNIKPVNPMLLARCIRSGRLDRKDNPLKDISHDGDGKTAGRGGDPKAV